MKKFDLTTKEGLNEIVKSNFICINPLFALGKYVIDKIFIESEDKQRELAEKIIVEGKRQGVDELEIKVKNFSGASFNLPLEDSVKIESHIGINNEIVIKVKYK